MCVVLDWRAHGKCEIGGLSGFDRIAIERVAQHLDRVFTLTSV